GRMQHALGIHAPTAPGRQTASPEGNCILPTPYCILHTAYCILPTAYCLLHTAYCSVQWSIRSAAGRRRWWGNARSVWNGPSTLIHSRLNETRHVHENPVFVLVEPVKWLDSLTLQLRRDSNNRSVRTTGRIIREEMRERIGKVLIVVVIVVVVIVRIRVGLHFRLLARLTGRTLLATPRAA